MTTSVAGGMTARAAGGGGAGVAAIAASGSLVHVARRAWAQLAAVSAAAISPASSSDTPSLAGTDENYNGFGFHLDE